MTLTDLYIISVDYYCGDEDGNEWTEQAFLGIEGKNRILVFDDKPCSRTKVFRGQQEALAYVQERNLNDSICYENLQIIPLEDALA